MRCALMNGPRHREGGQKEAVESGVDVRRHRCLDDFDTTAGIVHQVLGHEGFAKRLDSALFNHPLSRIAFQRLDSGRLAARSSLTHDPRNPRNLRDLVFLDAAGLPCEDL
jgi:hypothetical protein